jgi:hypothetical protein
VKTSENSKKEHTETVIRENRFTLFAQKTMIVGYLLKFFLGGLYWLQRKVRIVDSTHFHRRASVMVG